MSPSTPGDAALSVQVSSPQKKVDEPVPVSVPEQGDEQAQAQPHSQSHTQERTQPAAHGEEQALPPASTLACLADPHHSPGGVKSPVPGQQLTAGVLSTPTGPAPSVEKHVTPDSNDKWHKGPASASVTVAAPAVSKRPNGPSLLTQQLAEARGKPPPVAAQTVDPPHPSPRLQQPSYNSANGRHQTQAPGDQGNTPTTQAPIDDPLPHDGDDDDALTPRASPRAVAMATTAAVSTLSLPSRTVDTILSRTFDTSDVGYVTPRLGSHRDFLRSSGRGTSLERTDRDNNRLKGPGSAFTTRTYSDTSAPPTTTSTMVQDRDAGQPSGKPDPGSAAEPRSPTRPRKLDHRLSMGPEKAWSIGSEDLNNGQDGQVEKAIAEVLAGVEPNARSRKASHSLRFFKEGLPEEKLKRRDSRLEARDKLSATDDIFYDETTRGNDLAKSLQSSPHPASEGPGNLKRTRTLPIPSANEPQHKVKEPLDYFLIRPGLQTHDESATEIEDASRTSRSPQSGKPTVTKRDHEGSSDGAVEDADLSGEEKISSAVFVPHKGPQGVSENSDESEADLDAPVKPPLRNDHGSSWLVKADEPEADEPSTPEAQPEEQATNAADRHSETGHSLVGEAVQNEARPAQSPVSEHDFARQTQQQSSQVVSPDPGDHVHDHQSGTSQPLDAIELVPYRHQVGGHTTLWRFSKRAVCKQLNNRENEFYEQIEKYHRDLLPFLPRYIGVLNVTFSKQARRKSTVKKDTTAISERKQPEQDAQGATEAVDAPAQLVTPSKDNSALPSSSQPRLISQSLHSGSESVPTVTFLDNQHILPRSLLQPAVKTLHQLDRVRSSSVSVPASHYLKNGSESPDVPARPTLEDRHANSWGTTMVNKKLRHEVFSDAFLKSPISVQRHKKAYQRSLPKKTLDRLLRPASSDPTLMRAGNSPASLPQQNDGENLPSRIHQKTQSDLGLSSDPREATKEDRKDATGTSAPEPDILNEAMSPERKKRRHSGSALRRRPEDVSDSRGDLRYWEEPDEAGYKGDNEDLSGVPPKMETLVTPHAQSFNGAPEPREMEQSTDLSNQSSAGGSLATSPTSEFKKILRPVNPKEAQTQRDSRVSYFLLLEDLTAGMKKPCIMDLKMGTRQYGVEASVKKQKSQQRKCAQTTSRELGVRVCGLQVWDAQTQEYVFRDKYYGRSIKAGGEFQEALTRFLFDGKDRSSILRHIPTVLQKLSKLEVIARRLRGYRFYAASLLVTYDGDQSDQDNYDTAVEDSTTDFATDNEDNNYVRKRKNKREIDFKIADFANSVTPQDLTKEKPCPPQHPDEPDRGFLKGLRSLRRYFLKIQQETRAELGLSAAQRNIVYDPQMDVSEDESMSE